MLAIKLKRIGKKGQASFRVIVAEKRSKINGRYVEDLGWFNPHSDKFSVKPEAVKNWLAKGAQPTESAHNLLVRAGVLTGPKKPVHAKSKKTAAPQAEKNPATAEKTA